MSGAFDVRGTGQLIKKATAFRNYDPVLRRGLARKLTVALAPVKAELRQSARATLPRRGGLGAVVAASRINTRTVLAGKTAGIRLTMTNGADIAAMDRGRLRHPLYGNRNFWYSQEIKPGWWTDVADKVKPVAALAAKQVLDEIAEGRHG